ncbi:MAG TPA: shikimate kinase [Candidatus Cryosericum sp.]|nr:shikimate kinase [Candidatus Cryosericum sp.]
MPPARPPSELLQRVGQAVRRARRDRDLTRRDLAALSAVSERFLAQIEGGRGNVSLLRLDDLARALGVPLLRLLSPSPAAPRARFALVGLRGAGKSTVGRLLARRLKMPFLELDALIEDAAGLPVAQIFELHGERYFRRLEREVLARLAASDRTVVLATGGGLVTDPETYGLLRSAFTTIWLAADPEDHYARVLAQGDRRPMAGNPDAMVELRALLTARRPLYQLARLRIDTSRVSAPAAVRAITSAIERLTSTAPA